MARLAEALAKWVKCISRIHYMYAVYVLKSRNFPKSYVGITQDLNKRIVQHNSGKSSYTRKYMPWDVVHVEYLDNRVDCRKKEVFYKTLKGRRILKKIFAFHEKNK